jgi:peptide/nickel transport system substrate-binding protein
MRQATGVSRGWLSRCSAVLVTFGFAVAATAIAPQVAASKGPNINPNGTIKVITNLTPASSGGHWDPILMTTPAYPPTLYVYDALLLQHTDGTYTPELAKSAKVVNPSEIQVVLRPNLKFSDGTPLDASAVQFNILRNRDSKNYKAFDATIADVSSVTVVDNVTANINLDQPIAGAWFQFLARCETMLVSPTAIKNGVNIDTHPVGAGPYNLQSLVPQQSATLVKNPTYWNAKNVRTNNVELINAVDPTSQENALRSGAANAMDSVPTTTVQALQGSNIVVHSIATDSSNLWGEICKAQGPLSNVLVRQALNYAMPRAQISQVLDNGAAEPMTQLVDKKDPLYDATYGDMYKTNLKKAKQLLAEAGYANGLTLNFFILPGDSTTVSQVVQQYWKQIGVNLVLANTSNSTALFFNEQKTVGADGLIFPLLRGGLDKIVRSFIPGGSGDICQSDYPDLDAVVSQIRQVSITSPKAKTLWAQATKIIFGQALALFGDFTTVNEAVASNLGNPTYIESYQGIPQLWVPAMYVKG